MRKKTRSKKKRGEKLQKLPSKVCSYAVNFERDIQTLHWGDVRIIVMPMRLIDLLWNLMKFWASSWASKKIHRPFPHDLLAISYYHLRARIRRRKKRRTTFPSQKRKTHIRLPSCLDKCDTHKIFRAVPKMVKNESTEEIVMWRIC